MKAETKRRINLALLNAAEFIRQHGEIGLSPEDVGEVDEKGLELYSKACDKAFVIIEKIAERYLDEKN